MMLSVIVAIGLGLVQEGGKKATESEIRSAHQMLSGEWQIIALSDNGDSLGPELVRRKVARNGAIRISNRIITHVNPETGETRTTGYMLNPVEFPRQIDLITPEERVLPGIYKFEHDELVVCFASREGKTRPSEFVSFGGSYITLMRMRVTAGDSNESGKTSAAAASKPADSADPSTPGITPRARKAAPKDEDLAPEADEPAAAKTRTASLSVSAARPGDRKPTQGELNRDRDLLNGNWEIQAVVDDGQRLSADIIRAKMAEDGRVKIGVRGMSVISPRDESKRLWAYRIDPAQSPRHMDVITQFDTVLKGIYSFEGDTLRICVAKNEDQARPAEFDAPNGSGQMLYKLKMVKDEPAPKPAPAPVQPPVEVKAQPPQPSPEELARRKEQQIRQMLVGSWSLTDKKGHLVTVFRTDGSFTATRNYSKRRLFEPDIVTSNGSWSYGQGVLSARVTGTNDRDLLGYGFVGRLQSIGDDALVTADNSGKLLTLRKVR